MHTVVGDVVAVGDVVVAAVVVVDRVRSVAVVTAGWATTQAVQSLEFVPPV